MKLWNRLPVLSRTYILDVALAVSIRSDVKLTMAQ